MESDETLPSHSFLLISYNLRQIRHVAFHCQIVAKDSGKAHVNRHPFSIAATQHHQINCTYFTNFFSYYLHHFDFLCSIFQLWPAF